MTKKKKYKVSPKLSKQPLNKQIFVKFLIMIKIFESMNSVIMDFLLHYFVE